MRAVAFKAWRQVRLRACGHRRQQIDVSEGTIYPLLKRLRAEGYFEVYLRESTSGPARKYYRLTQKGYDTQRLLENEWKDFTKSVSTLLGGENGD